MSSGLAPTERVHDTELAQLTLLGERSKHGVVDFRQHGSGLNLVRQPYYQLNVYRFMDQGRLMAIARDEPFETKINEDGMTLKWQATDDHPAELDVEYRVSDPAIIDLFLTSRTLQPLRNYEVYLSSYFDFSMDPYIVLPDFRGKTERADQRIAKLVDNEIVHSHYLVFPKDERSATLRMDGRWNDPSTGKTIAYWVTGPSPAFPIVFMARDKEYIVQMIDPKSWFNIGTTYAGHPWDDIVRHNALYISLFGHDTEANTRQTARIRQVLCKGEPTLEHLFKLYDDFLSTNE